jgi:hypothetical protein
MISSAVYFSTGFSTSFSASTDFVTSTGFATTTFFFAKEIDPSLVTE